MYAINFVFLLLYVSPNMARCVASFYNICYKYIFFESRKAVSLTILTLSGSLYIANLNANNYRLNVYIDLLRFYIRTHARANRPTYMHA